MATAHDLHLCRDISSIALAARDRHLATAWALVVLFDASEGEGVVNQIHVLGYDTTQ